MCISSQNTPQPVNSRNPLILWNGVRACQDYTSYFLSACLACKGARPCALTLSAIVALQLHHRHPIPALPFAAGAKGLDQWVRCKHVPYNLAYHAGAEAVDDAHLAEIGN